MRKTKNGLEADMADGGTELRKYLVVLLLDVPTMDRLTKIGSAVLRILRSASVADPEVAFTAKDRSTVAYLIKTQLSSREIHSRIKSPGGTFNSTTPAILLGNESVLVFELGAGFCIDNNLARVSTWLQRK